MTEYTVENAICDCDIALAMLLEAETKLAIVEEQKLTAEQYENDAYSVMVKAMRWKPIAFYWATLAIITTVVAIAEALTIWGQG